jgi:putative transposase
VRAVLHDARFVDKAPAEVYATLLDEGRYLCSARTMYRLLDADDELRERRNILGHKNHPRPELLATRPNELWSWDITKLHGPRKWTYYYLYVILDVFSRYTVAGWWPTPNLRLSQRSSSNRPAIVRELRETRSRFTRTAGLR